MSGNHNQSLERALTIVNAAAKAGAHAIKLQTYTAETMTLKGVVKIEDENSLWYGEELYSLYEKAHTPWDWHKPIFEKAKELGILAFSSPFDATAVDFLEELNAPIYKIASFENTDHPLLKKVARTGKPVIMSTGVSKLSDIAESVEILRTNGCEDLTLLKCTSTYPASPEKTNINTIPHLQKLFNCKVGLSDHTLGIGVAIASVALGATVIEKHFTLSRADGGVDSAFSLEPHELKALCEESKRAYLSLGDIQYGIQDVEKNSKIFKRSIYVSKSIKAGEVYTETNIRVLRPGHGLEPKYYEKLLGTKAKKDLERGTPLKLEDIL